MMTKGLREVIQVSVLLLLGLCLQSFSHASWHDVQSGTLLLQSDSSGTQWVAPTLDADVALTVSGPIVRAVVSQTFHNPSDQWVEAVYVFPLPETAAVDHMRLVVEERIIEGQIKEKQAAKKLYKQAKQQGKRASLVAQERPNVFTTSVANIPPGEQVVVVIEYQQAVSKQDDLYSLRFPMTITPRYTPGNQIRGNQVSTGENTRNGEPDQDAIGIEPSMGAANLPDQTSPLFELQGLGEGLEAGLGVVGKNYHPVQLTIDLQPGFMVDTVESLYHPVNKEVFGADQQFITLEANAHQANADFVLQWRPLGTENPQVAFFTETHQQQKHSLLMVSPPQQQAELDTLAREVIYVIDTSGSMGGESIRQAKRALLWAIGQLNAEDSFNIIEFNSDTWSLFTQAQPANRTNIRTAKNFIKRLQARGGTEMLKAMKTALCGTCRNHEHNPDRLRQVIFLTDGAIGNEDQLLTTLKQRLGESRLFTVGIGSAPNTFFMRKAAEAGRGHFTYIADTNRVAETMAQLFSKINAPLMTDITVTDQHGNAINVLPNPIPDLYHGQPLLIMIDGDLPETVMITGTRGGIHWEHSVQANTAKQRHGIHVLWARNKIEQLMDEHRYSRSVEQRQGLKDEIIHLSLHHHLVTAYTSLVAVDVTPVKPVDENTHSHRIPGNSPKGSTLGLARTATPAGLQIQVGLLLLLLAGLVNIRRLRGSLSTLLNRGL